MKDLDKNAMSRAIKEVISIYDVRILADEFRFQAAIRDILCGSSFLIERQLLIFSIKIGVGRILSGAVGKTDAEQKNVISIAKNLLVEDYGFDENRSNSILAAFIAAFSWEEATCPTKSISFGNYKWIVLYARKGKALLLSEQITDIGIPYNAGSGGTSWEDCTLRQWLNTVFLARFSEKQQKRILSRTLRAENNPWYQTNAGNPTKDKVFLLSISEVIRCLGDRGSLGNRPVNRWRDDTDKEGMSCAIDDKFNAKRCAAYKNESTWWWLRSPGESESKAAYVNAEGIVFLNGELAFDDGGTSCVGVRPGVRPAIWVRQ